MREDSAGRANFDTAQGERFILSETRTFCEVIGETFLRRPG